MIYRRIPSRNRSRRSRESPAIITPDDPIVDRRGSFAHDRQRAWSGETKIDTKSPLRWGTGHLAAPRFKYPEPIGAIEIEGSRVLWTRRERETERTRGAGKSERFSNNYVPVGRRRFFLPCIVHRLAAERGKWRNYGVVESECCCEIRGGKGYAGPRISMISPVEIGEMMVDRGWSRKKFGKNNPSDDFIDSSHRRSYTAQRFLYIFLVVSYRFCESL